MHILLRAVPPSLHQATTDPETPGHSRARSFSGRRLYPQARYIVVMESLGQSSS